MGNQGSVLNEKDKNRFMKINNSILALTWKNHSTFQHCFLQPSYCSPLRYRFAVRKYIARHEVKASLHEVCEYLELLQVFFILL